MLESQAGDLYQEFQEILSLESEISEQTALVSVTSRCGEFLTIVCC